MLVDLPGDIVISKAQNLDIKSHDIQRYFTDPRHPIVPWKHDRYKSFFENKPPDVSLTYEWSTSFKEIRAYLDFINIKRHNATVSDPNPSLSERLYLMSFVWVVMGPLTKIPLDIEERTIFVDIMYNDQTHIGNIEKELELAERHYKETDHHVIIGTKRVLERAWCLYEIAARREAGKRSQLLHAPTGEADQTQELSISLPTVLFIFFFRLWILGLYSMWTCISICKYVYGIDEWCKELSLSSHAVVTGARISVDYLTGMAASKESDLEGIRAKIRRVFGEDPDCFNWTIASATFSTKCSRLEMSFLLWLETLSFVALIPVNIASAGLSLVLVLLFAPPVLCHSRGQRWLLWSLDEDAHVSGKLRSRKLRAWTQILLARNMSPAFVQFVQNWCWFDALIHLPFVAVIASTIFLALALPALAIILASKALAGCLKSC